MPDRSLRSSWFGPGLMVTAAFIGPGTVTTAWMSGAKFQFSLLWVVVVATGAAIILQEMSARLGVLTGQGLGETLRQRFTRPAARWTTAALVILAIGVGNAAYQTGNLLGASIGVQAMIGLDIRWIVAGVVVIAALLLGTGSYRTWEGCLTGFVALMGFTFVVAAIMSCAQKAVPLVTLLPAMPERSLVTVLGLVGTTIVPYNLFLHASSTARHWSRHEPIGDALRAARRDCVISVAVGGMITAAILVTAAVTMDGRDPASVKDMAGALSSALGDTAARWMFAAGLAAAGLTSAITAPLAAAYAVSGVLGLPTDSASASFRAIWISILVCGAVLALTFGGSPVHTIIVAQAANAVLLPFIAAFLWMVCNTKILGEFRNGRFANIIIAGLLVSLVGLSAWNIWKLF